MSEEKKYKEIDLVYAAYNRCPCGAGLAYPRNIGMHGYWDSRAPNGATTRPDKKTVVDKRIRLGKIELYLGVIQVVYEKGKALSTLRLKYLR